jgi:acetyl-CoA acetyltransferase family protein
MTTAVIVDAIRTPMGKRNGQLKDWHPVDLAAETLKALVDRTGIDPAVVDDVVMGCVMQVGEQGVNVARNAVLAAGWPEDVPGTTVDRQCGSSQQAAHFAAQGVMAGAYDVVVAAGVEVMTRVPMGASMADGKFGYPFGPAVGARYADQGGLVPQGISAELIADKWNISRDDMDAFGARSQQFAARATAEGRFDREILPVLGAEGQMVSVDGGLRETTMESLAKLKPSFRPEEEGGRVTAGNSSQITDGASALLIMSEEKRRPARPHATGPLRQLRPRRLRPEAHAHRPHPGHPQGARAGRDVDRRHGSHRDQRSVRLGGAGLGEGTAPEHGHGQRERRRDRPRSPARLLRRPADDHAAQRARAHRRPVRPPDDV